MPELLRRAHVSVAALALVLGVATAPGVAGAQDDSGARYRGLLEDAVAEYNAGNWAEARALFRRAHQLQPNARTLRGIGMAAFEQREYVDALHALEASLEDERKPLTRAQREHVRDLIERANAFVGRFRIALAPAEAELRVDGAPAELDDDGTLLLDLGDHRLVADCEGCEPETRRLEVRGGEERALSFELRRIGEAAEDPMHASGSGPPDPGPSDPGTATMQVDPGGDMLSIALLSGAALALGGTIGGAVWWKDRNDEIDRCDGAGDACRNGGTLEGQRNAAIGVTVGLAAVAAALGVAGLVTLGGDDEEQAGAARCVPGLGGASCAVRF